MTNIPCSNISKTALKGKNKLSRTHTKNIKINQLILTKKTLASLKKTSQRKVVKIIVI